jgi:hypothetical protein
MPKWKLKELWSFISLLPAFHLRVLFYLHYGVDGKLTKIGENNFAIFKMRAIFKSVWVRKLIGKLGVPYNRRLRVRGSSHPLFYDADLSLPAADSNAFRAHSDWLAAGFPIVNWSF